MKPRFLANTFQLGFATSNPKWKFQLPHIHSALLSTMPIHIPRQNNCGALDKTNVDHGIHFYNPSLWLMTKARAWKGGAESHIHTLESVKECEGMYPHTPKWTPILGVGVLVEF
jgi:hypothetical protein